MDTLSLSPLALFEHAGWIGKGVMITLAVFSVYCWMLIAEIIWIRLRLRRDLRQSSAELLSPLFAPLSQAGRHAAGVRLAGEATGEARARIEDAIERAARRLMQPAHKSLNGLAIISSSAPFIGLFGTVWGIVTSFTAIASTRDTSLAVVAPGIAEALAATAFGLLAAIPASMAYNRLSAGLNGLAADLSDLAADHAVHLLASGARGEGP